MELVGVLVSEPKEVQYNMGIIELAIRRAKMVFDVDYDIEFTFEELESIQLSCSKLCRRNKKVNRIARLSEIFFNTFQECLLSKVIPSLQRSKDDPQLLLTELVANWEKFTKMIALLSNILLPLETSCFGTIGLSLKAMAYEYIASVLCGTMLGRFLDAAILMFKQERVGFPINAELLKKVINFLIECDIGLMKRNYYEKFEKILLDEFASYYANLSLEWITRDSFKIYIWKVERHLFYEKRRITNCLPPCTVAKILEVVRSELLDEKARRLLETYFCF